MVRSGSVTVMTVMTLMIATSALSYAATPATLPARLGGCAFTTVRSVEQRLVDGSGRPVPDSGSAVVLGNGVYGVSYGQVPAVNQSRRGDRVMTCLTRVPQHCPPGDRRGKWYTTTNLRTNEAWVLPDAEHECGGA